MTNKCWLEVFGGRSGCCGGQEQLVEAALQCLLLATAAAAAAAAAAATYFFLLPPTAMPAVATPPVISCVFEHFSGSQGSLGCLASWCICIRAGQGRVPARRQAAARLPGGGGGLFCAPRGSQPLAGCCICGSLPVQTLPTCIVLR